MPRRNQVDNSSRRTWTRRGEAFHDTDSHNLDPAQAGCSSNSSSFQQVGIGFSESADDYEERDDAQIKDIGIRLKLMYVSAMLSKAGLSQNQARLMCDDVCEVMVDKGSRIFASKKNGKRLYPRAREQDDASQKYCQNRPEHSRSPYQRAREQDGVYEHQHDKPSVRPIHLASGPRFAKASHGFDDRFEINPKSLKVELLSSIKSGNFDTITASLILLEYHDSGKYNPAQYQEFLDDGKLIQITRFDAFSPLLPQEICRHPDSLILDKFRQMLKDDVNLVLNRHALLSVHKQNDKISKEFDLRANRDLKFSRVNLVSNTLCIPEDADFKAVDIFELLKTWPAPPENHNAYDKLFSATKYVLSQLTKKPGEIGRFTHTFSGNKPRKYTKLPDTIVNTLGDMMLQLTDTYDPILNYSVEQAPEKYPAKWSSLADDEQSRIRKFNSLKSLKGKVLDSFNKTLIEALSELRRVDFKSDHQSSNAPLKRKSSG